MGGPVLSTPNPAVDDAFARLVKQLLMATDAQLDDARRLQVSSGLRGAPLTIAEALVQNGVMTQAHKETVEAKLEAQKQAGNHLGPYKILRKLGEGGMGAVYLAQEPADGRKVALKVLPKRHTKDGDFLQRFKREAEAAIQLNHVNIARAYSAGEERGHAYYAMEYCEGEPLKERLKREKFLPAEAALALVMQIARGLKYAHGLGFIHRDIKPDNVIVTPLNVAKILDLGLAKNIEDAEQSFRTQTGVAIGTPHYIAPEQARGDKDIDGRADIYSLGATFYHLVTGDTPFHGSSSYEIITKHLTEQLPDPRDLREDIPEHVVHVIRRMMAKTPEDRYKDCAELLIDLELVIDGKSPSSQALDAGRSSVAMPKRPRKRLVAAAPAPEKKDSKPPDGKKQKLLIFGGATAAVVVVAILAVVMMSGSPPPRKSSSGKEEVVVVAPKPPAEAKRPSPAPAPVEPEVKLTPEEAREREAQRKLDRIKALEKAAGVRPIDIQAEYDRFVVEYSDTTAGRVIAGWLKSKLPKEPAPEIPAVAAVPVEKPVPEAPAPPPPPVVEPPKPSVHEPPQPLVRDPSLVGLWRLDDGSGATATDSSGRNHTGTLMESPAWIEGKSGRALQFDGKGAFVSVAHTESLRITGDMTVAFWMRMDSESREWVRLVGKGESGARNYGVWVDTAGNRQLIFQQYSPNDSMVIQVQGPSVELGRWTHVAATLEENRGHLYVNGEKVGEAVRSGLPATSTAPLTFGHAGWHGRFTGALDEIRIYNLALNAKDIRGLLSGVEPGKAPTPSLERARRPAHPAFPVKPGGGLLGAYYTNDDGTFKGAPVFLRVDPVISFDWAAASPDPRISTDGFSVRWTGEIMPYYSEPYTFDVIADEKVRLWVDGKLILDRWAGQGPTPGTILLQGGVRYNLKLEYNETQLMAWARLVWSSPSTPQQLVPRSQLYSTPTARLDEKPVPAATIQKEAAAMLREKFAADFKVTTRAGKEALSKKLVESAAAEPDLDLRYQALKEGQDLALSVGMGATALSAIELMADSFEIDALELKAAALRKMIPAAVTKPDAAALSSMYVDLIDEAIRMDKYDQAAEYIRAADRPARLTENELVLVQLQGRAIQVPELKREWDRIKAAFDKLKTTPDDPAASQAVGEFRAFFKREFWKGMPLLRVGADPVLKGLAELELGNSDDPRVQHEACELWLTLAEREKNQTKKLTLTDRARFWLFRASGNSVKGLLDASRKRLATLEDAMASKVAIDLLKIAEAPPPDVNNKKLPDGSIITNSYEMMIPYFPPEEYDFTVVVQLPEGAVSAGSVKIGLALPPGQGYFNIEYTTPTGAGNSQLRWLWGGGPSGGERFAPNKSISPTKTHTIRCYVRREAVTCVTDGEPILTWGGPFDTISIPAAANGTEYPTRGNLFIGSSGNPQKFSMAVVVPYKVPGKILKAK